MKRAIILPAVSLFSTLVACEVAPVEGDDLQVIYEALELTPHIHDPSRTVEVDGWRMIAVTGKENADGYTCGLETWYKAPGEDDWTPGQCLLQEKPEWVSEELPESDGAYWAPAFADPWTMYYSVAGATDDSGCLGRLTATGSPPEMIWTDAGEAITCTTPEEEGVDDPLVPNTIDPAFFEDEDGQQYLLYGGGSIWSVALDTETGDAVDGAWWDPTLDSHVQLASAPAAPDESGNDWIEAPFLHREGDHYYLFVNWYACCEGVDSTYEIRVGRAESPLGPFVDRDGVALLDGGGSMVLDSQGEILGDERYIGPGHAAVNTTDDGGLELTFHYYDRGADGLPWIGAAALRFEDGWPVVGGE